VSGGQETEEELVAMVMEDENADGPIDVRLLAKPAPAVQIRNVFTAISLNQWLVKERGGRRYLKGRLVVLDGGA
jgi:hypothetical protein